MKRGVSGGLSTFKDLGPFRYFLGIEVARSCQGCQGISLSQGKYSLDLVQDTCMLGCRFASMSMVPNMRISVESGELLPDPSISLEPSRASHALQMLTMRGLRVVNALFLAFVLFMVVISYPEKVRSKLLSLGLLLKPSTVPWLRAQVTFFGFDLF